MPACTAEHHAQGYCATHYSRLWKHGDPTEQGQRAQGELQALIAYGATGPHDECILVTGHATDRPVVKIDGVTHSVGRWAWIMAHGEPGPTLVLHKCPTGSDARCVNVRHLSLGDDRENAADRDREGRTVLRNRKRVT